MSHREPSLHTPAFLLSRRQLITAALGLLAGGLAGGLGSAGTEPGLALLTALTHPAAAVPFGRAYLADHPDEADAKVLSDRLSAALTAHRKAAATSAETAPPSLAAAIIELVQAEYLTEPLLRVDGWLLAPSEARLYALAALAR